MAVQDSEDDDRDAGSALGGEETIIKVAKSRVLSSSVAEST